MTFFFGGKDASPKTIAKLDNTTCCIIKPHAMKSKFTASIIKDIQASGFEIQGLQTFHLKYEHAEEFYEIYRGIVQDYTVKLYQIY